MKKILLIFFILFSFLYSIDIVMPDPNTGDIFLITKNNNSQAYIKVINPNSSHSSGTSSQNHPSDWYEKWHWLGTSLQMVHIVEHTSSGKIKWVDYVASFDYLDDFLPCLVGQEYDNFSQSCINSCDPLNGSIKDGMGGCYDCSFFNDLHLRANCLCDLKGYHDGAAAPTSTSIVTFNNVNYLYALSVCNGSDNIKVPVYLKDEDLDFSPDPCLTAISWGAVSPVGFIFKGSVHSTDECSQYVDGTDYLDSRTKKAYPDCPSSNELYCYLKPSADNNDTGIAAPDSNQTDENGNLKPDVTPPPLDINSTPSGYNMNTVEKTNNLLGQSLSDFKSFANKYNKDNEWWKKDNTRKFNTRTQNDNANNARLIASNTANSNKIKSSIEKLNGTIGEKLDTLIDKNTSVDLSPATDKLDQLHKDLNTTNNSLTKLNKSFDSNESVPATALDDNVSSPQLSELLPDDSFYSDNTLDTSGLDNYDGDCFLESFTWTDGSGVHTFPPQNVIDMIPFDVVSNLMLAFIYLLGLREFLRS